ncbi:MAG: hypothetical protein PHU34_06975 [Candidatus Methanoperedens sp.]|nr:hypothetical protein [Candidatus Methanoperedens sp.]
MSTERDIIIERLEQKLAARDKEFTQMQESLRESIINEMEKRFTDKIKLRESTLDEISKKFGEKINEIIEMNKSLRDSLLEQQKVKSDVLRERDSRMDRLERRLIELNSSYDGVMKELLDQKSIIQELTAKKVVIEEIKAKPEIKPKVEEKPPEKPKPKNEYIIADNYVPREKRKQQPVIEAEEKTIVADEKLARKEQLKKQAVKKSEKVIEGVEIVETLKRGK